MQLVDKVLRPNTNVAAIPGEILNLKKNSQRTNFAQSRLC